MDGVSEKEARFIKLYAEGIGWSCFDPSNIKSVKQAADDYKIELAKTGLIEKMLPLTAFATTIWTIAACWADGEVSEAEFAGLKETAECWGLDPDKTREAAVDCFQKEKDLITKKMVLITGNEDGKWTYTPVESYCANEVSYLSFERLYFTRTEIPLAVSDITLQMQCFASLASVDGLSDLEKAWVNSYAVYCGVDGKLDLGNLPAIDSLKEIIDGIAGRSGFDAKQLAAELIYNCVRVCQIDGFSEVEKSALVTISSQLGLVEGIVAQFENLVEEEYALHTFKHTNFAEMCGLSKEEMLAIYAAV